MPKLDLTDAEARGLFALADEGAQGLLTDDSAAKAYIGNKAQQAAAERALEKLRTLTYGGRAADNGTVPTLSTTVPNLGTHEQHISVDNVPLRAADSGDATERDLCATKSDIGAQNIPYVPQNGTADSADAHSDHCGISDCPWCNTAPEDL